MASKFSDYVANALLGWVAGTNMPTAPATVYMSLHDGNCGVNGTGGTDVTATVRPAGRVAVDWGAVATRQLKNDAVVDFGNADGPCEIESVALWDAASGGNCLTGGLLPVPLTITDDLPVKVPLSQLVVGLTVA